MATATEVQFPQRKYPAVPMPQPEPLALHTSTDALRERLQILLREKGAVEDSCVTVRDLIALGWIDAEGRNRIENRLATLEALHGIIPAFIGTQGVPPSDIMEQLAFVGQWEDIPLPAGVNGDFRVRYELQQRVVRLEVRVDRGGANIGNIVLGNIPVGYRPNVGGGGYVVYTIRVPSGTGQTEVRIEPGGIVEVVQGGNTDDLALAMTWAH